VIIAQVVRYRRERWLTPTGETIVAPRPAGTRGHIGPELRRYVLMQHHQGQVTLERPVAQLQTVGISISKREVILTKSHSPESQLVTLVRSSAARGSGMRWRCADCDGAG
jgi:hypothetical protein